MSKNDTKKLRRIVVVNVLSKVSVSSIRWPVCRHRDSQMFIA